MICKEKWSLWDKITFSKQPRSKFLAVLKKIEAHQYDEEVKHQLFDAAFDEIMVCSLL